MYVPVIIDPCAFYDYRYLWEYLKYLYHCCENDWPIVAAEEFKDYKQKRPVSNVYETEFCRLHQYRLLEEAEENSVKKYFISEKIFTQLEETQGSKLGAKLYLLQKRCRPLEKEIQRILCQIKKDTGKQIEGILNWNAHFISVRYVAEKMHIPVITNEFSIRFPDYYPLAYFCRRDIYEEQEIKKWYACFLQEKERIDYPLLSKKEILALFLQKKHLNRLEEMCGREPEYEMGIAGCHPLIATFFAKSMYTDLELIEDVRHFYKEEDILFRKHPGDEPYQAEYTMKQKDASPSAIDFLLRCKRVTAVGSNILVEAMLWGRQVYSKTVSPYTFLAEGHLSQKAGGVVGEEALNFIFFAFLIPYNRMLEEDYMKWRLKTNKTEQIMKKNISYYFKEMGIPEQVLYRKENRLKAMLAHRLGNGT